MMRVIMLPFRLAAFALWFAVQVLRSAWQVLSDILTPGINNTPRVVTIPLASRSDFHVAVIGVLITLTPGTLTLGVMREKDGSRTFLVHAMYFRNEATALLSLQDMERRMLRALARRDAS